LLQLVTVRQRRRAAMHVGERALVLPCLHFVAEWVRLAV
jgi:hypothetical protein